MSVPNSPQYHGDSSGHESNDEQMDLTSDIDENLNVSSTTTSAANGGSAYSEKPKGAGRPKSAVIWDCGFFKESGKNAALCLLKKPDSSDCAFVCKSARYKTNLESHLIFAENILTRYLNLMPS